LVPVARPVIVVAGESELVIVPLPEMSVQAPVPATGAFAFIVAEGEEIQRV